jgi:Cu+-exporting ATPase
MEVVDKVEYVNDSLSILASIEKHSDHPLGYSLKDIANNDLEITNIENHLGKGISGIYNNERYYVGSIKFIKEVCKEEINIDILNLEKEGKNVVLISTSNKIQALVTLKDQVKESSLLALSLFKKEGIEVIMATGDNIDIASLVAKEVGIDRFKANCMPLDKKDLIDELHKENKKVLMIGDGINDAVSLASSDVSIAVDSKVDVAKNTSDIVLVEPDLLVAYNAYYLSKKTVRNIKINLFWAFFYNIIAIPLAAGVFYNSLGIKLSPMLGALCMSLSSLCVCLNALRLKNIKWKEIEKMKLEFYVDDMMCMHCVNRIKEALSVKGIENINIDLDSKLVSVETSLKKEAVFKLIKKAKYKVREK